jgi:adenylate kinase
MSTFDKAMKTEEEVLVAVAETIGSTLGTISAKAGEAKKALLAANSSRKRAAKRTAKTLNRTLRSTQRSAKKAVKKAKRATRKSSAKASKSIRKGRKAIRSRMR